MTVVTIDTLCLQAQQAVKQRDWEKARQLFLQALGLKSDLPDVHNGLATVCFQLRDLTSASYHFKEVTRLDPLRAGAFINLGAVYNLLGQYDEAVTALRRGIQLDGRLAEGYYNLGLAYKRKGQLDLGIQAYREALRLNPRMGDAHYNLGNLYLEKQLWRQAVDHYTVALQLRPNWDKAIEGLRQAREALDEQQASREQEQAEIPQPRLAPTPAGVSIDPGRVVDPEKHGTLLNVLHKTTIESETHGETFLRLLQEEIEPALKDLSTSLLNAGGSHTDLDQCVRNFEKALDHFRTAQTNLQTSIRRIRTIGDQFTK